MRCVWDPVMAGRRLLLGGREFAPGAEVEVRVLTPGLLAQGLRPAVEVSESAPGARPEPERASPAPLSDAPAAPPVLDAASDAAPEPVRPDVPEADVLRVARALGFTSAGRGVRERAAAFLAAQPAAAVAAALGGM